MMNTLLDSGFAAVKKTRYGYMVYNKYDRYIGRSLDLYGEFSYFEAELFSQIVKPNMHVLDVGANIGAFSLLFSKLVGVNGRVYSFEPQRATFQMLCGNLAINSIENVFAYQNCVGSSNEPLYMPNVSQYVENNFGGISASTEKKEGFLSVDSLQIDQLELQACHFIKVDVEGMELEVLMGALNTINKYKPIMYIENDRKEKSEALITKLKKLGYRLYPHNPSLFNPNNFFNQSRNIFGNIVSKNLVCIHKTQNITVEGMKEL